MHIRITTLLALNLDLQSMNEHHHCFPLGSCADVGISHWRDQQGRAAVRGGRILFRGPMERIRKEGRHCPTAMGVLPMQ